MPDYFQLHECSGYRAKVTIEWTAPDGIELLPDRAGTASDIAGDALAGIARAPFEIVQAMMGRRSR